MAAYLNHEQTVARLGDLLGKLASVPEDCDRLAAWATLNAHQREAIADLTNAVERFLCRGVCDPRDVEIDCPTDHPQGYRVCVGGSVVAFGLGRDGADGQFYRLTGQRAELTA